MCRDMRLGLFIFFSCCTVLLADYSAEFKIGSRTYQLNGGHAVITQKNGKVQLLLGVRDTVAKAQFAITAEVPESALQGGPTEINAEYLPVSAVIVNSNGIYSLAPHTTLSRDTFMTYNAKEQIYTGEMEDDPKDRPQERIHECRHGLNESCQKLMKQHRHKRPKVRVRYIKHGPTWVGKSRKERLDSGDGIHHEKKYDDTVFTITVIPVIVGGKITAVTGTFAGVVLYNQGMTAAQKATIQNGKFSMQVQNGF